jgi:hypothetical protein
MMGNVISKRACAGRKMMQADTANKSPCSCRGTLLTEKDQPNDH